MGEIKSTLDLVMERTRHLTLSSAEKSAHQTREQGQQLRGLIQRFLDQTFTFTELESKLAADFPAELGKSQGALHRELLERIDPTGDNEAILFLIQELCDADPTPLTDLLEEFNQALAAKQAHYSTRHLAELASGHGIRGTAVVPNLDHDGDWYRDRADLIARYEARLRNVQ